MPVLSRLRAQGGFTLPEVLTAMSIFMVIGLGAFALVDISLRRSGEVAQRVETTQRARMAMDTMTRQLRSQVCLGPDVEPLLAGSTGTSVSFYADFTEGGGTPVPQLRTLTWDAGTRRITETAYTGTYVGPDPEDIQYDLASPPARRATVLDAVVLHRARGATQDSPIFKYYAYNTASPPAPELELPTPLSAANASRVARIDIAFRALPSGVRGPTRISVPLEDQVYVRAADPNDPAPTPTCV